MKWILYYSNPRNLHSELPMEECIRTQVAAFSTQMHFMGIMANLMAVKVFYCA